MQILNFGSLNVDHVYAVDHFVRAGETLDTSSYQIFSGGKGFNQSIALARAGARVAHAGKVGEDGRWLLEELTAEGVDVDSLVIGEGPSGHAVIQVSKEGENCILICGGANRTIEAAQIEQALARCGAGAFLLIQNEINGLPRIMDVARDIGLHVVMNPSPMSADLLDLPLDRIGTFILNQVEGEALAESSDPEAILDRLALRFPDAEIVLTLGARGAMYRARDIRCAAPAEPTDAVDTTAAGDTFTGFYLAERLAGAAVEPALRLACRAAAACVRRPGAAISIPRRAEIA